MRVSSSAIPAAFGSALAFLAGSGDVRAQAADLGANDFTIDLYQGPVLASGRVTAMGGAYAGYAQGIGAYSVNAAAPAVRHSHSTSWVDVDIDASLSFPIVFFQRNDFDNSGESDGAYQSYVYLSAGTNVQVGNFGFGFFGDLQRYGVTFPPANEPTSVAIGRYHVLGAYQFFGGQFVLGGGVRAHSLNISAPGRGLDTELGMVGVSPEVGFLVKPDWAPFRIGATYRHAVSGLLRSDSRTTIDERGVRRAGGLVVPNDMEMPWEITAGLAFQVGPRPLNPRWLNPREHEREFEAARAERRTVRERRRATRLEAIPPGPERALLAAKLEAESLTEARDEELEAQRDRSRLEAERRAILHDWPREYLLVTTDLLVTGPVDNGVSLERFLGQAMPASDAPCQATASGRAVNFSPRVGLEIEPIPNWVHTRVGSYYEPTRFRYAPEACNDRVGRQHFTFGADVKAFKTTWFGLADEVNYKVQFNADIAPRYQSFGAGFGVWY